MIRYHLFAFLLLILGFFIQPFIGVIDVSYQAILQLAPMIFLCIACTVSYPSMLLMAFFCGLIWDSINLPLLTVHPALQKVDHFIGGMNQGSIDTNQLVFGYSIFLLAIAGTFMQGVRPFFNKRRWELPLLMVGIATFLWMFLEYLCITVIRQELIFPREMWIKLISNSILAMVFAPIIILLLHKMAIYTGHTIHYEGLRVKQRHVY